MRRRLASTALFQGSRLVSFTLFLFQLKLLPNRVFLEDREPKETENQPQSRAGIKRARPCSSSHEPPIAE